MREPEEPPRQELAGALTELFAHRRRVDEHRADLASAAADALVAELVTAAPLRLDRELEDELCTRMGALLREWADGPLEDGVSPDLMAEATVTAAAAAVGAALREVGAEPDGWRAAWRVLTVAAGLVAVSSSETVTEAIDALRAAPGGRVLPRTIDGPTVTGQVLWARDAYGSRFGVTAAVRAPDGPDRWYLWDIDTCGYQPFTVHSAYYPTSERALAAWQAGVGEVAAAGTTFTPVEDRQLLAQVMPAEEGPVRAGGEKPEQLAEYRRCRRLARAAIDAVAPGRPEPPVGLDTAVATAAAQFIAWLGTHRADRPQPSDLDELVTELADSWCFSGPVELYSTCSPHRVALTVLHLRNYYTDDFSAQLVALLPDWTCWLADRNGTPSRLAERCRPYALGEPHPDLGTDDSKTDYLARVIE
jgi:hypothetical protein